MAVATASYEKPVFTFCLNDALIEFELNIRHGSALKYCTVWRLITVPPLSGALLKSTVLKGLELSTRKLLDNGADHFAETVDAE